ncbi:hypothetical protein CHLNCDRAFT_143611 [Chlorella variabilis]|uniref:Phytocyanin domain-containing protein n=1 Tax=Chlorella variabilis TaxID=554065 RepID=E1ZA38_CHLVA|nr:hypothetical protein CHLNCDRAFT_143611 [Chlorella variabilis]EFN56989.1 hypothetical protein CHLNCDRAFT_143611 [Chlorella variabilis]|eukprot:XP_005849091.1 hypothetical protein CHLNCDRAFT_143611 [Chlorella variabilis]
MAASQAKVISVGWVHGKRLANINACIGDQVVFVWPKPSQHDLVETKTRTCSRAGGVTLARTTLGGYKSVAMTKAGNRHFMCSVGLHCPLGQIISVTTRRCAG